MYRKNTHPVLWAIFTLLLFFVGGPACFIGVIGWIWHSSSVSAHNAKYEEWKREQDRKDLLAIVSIRNN